MLEKKCRFCGATIDKESEICPICGRELGIAKTNNVSLIFIIVFIAIFGINLFSIFSMKSIFNNVGENTDIKDDFYENVVIEENKVINKNDKTLEQLQEEAIERAKSDLKYFSSSREEVIELLKMIGYEEAIAIYAADNCGADWNKQALDSAKSYLKYSAFSYEGLIKQLEYEKFTSEQAKYAVDNCGANWNEQASKKAKTYLKYYDYAREDLIKQLEYSGFTHEQAVYGVEANGL